MSSLRVVLRRTALAAAAAAALALPPAAGAKVIFTGYGNFLLTADSQFMVRGPASVLAATPEGNLIGRTFQAETVGLFASSKVGERADLLVDLTYRSIGATTRETRIQYAYIDAQLPWELRVEAGKVPLPFGYFNRNRFYPFRRHELSAPTFVSAILGLPISDVGAVFSRRFGDPEGWGVDARAYAVNGYGHVGTSTASLRSPLLPGGIGIAGNLGSSNNNKDIALGGQVALSKGHGGELGASYYRGAWDPSGRRILQLASLHLHLALADLDVLTEYLHIHAQNDEGFLSVLGDTGWTTHGAFVVASHPVLKVRETAVIGYAQGEATATRRTGGGPGQEVLRSAAGGLSARLNEWILCKGQFTWLYYRLPFVSQKSLLLEGHTLQLAMVLTF